MRYKPAPLLFNNKYIVHNKSRYYQMLMLDSALSHFFKIRIQPKYIRNVLIVNFGGIGDGIFLSRLADYINARTDIEFDLLCNADVSAIYNNNVFSNIHVIPMWFGRDYYKRLRNITKSISGIGQIYDAAICLRAQRDNGIFPLRLSGKTKYIIGFPTGGFAPMIDNKVMWRGGRHESEHYLEAFRALFPDAHLSDPKIFLEIPEHKFFGDYVVVHFGTKDVNKSLPIKSRIALLNKLISEGRRTILTGLPSDKYLYDQTGINNNLIIPTYEENYSFREWLSIISGAKSVYTVDTSAAHIAGALGIDTTCYMSGIVERDRFYPIGKQVTIKTIDVPCSPCAIPCPERECMQFKTDNI